VSQALQKALDVALRGGPQLTLHFYSLRLKRPRNRLDGGCDAEPTNKPGNPDR